ncbi:LysE family translocator [Gulosibacter sp. 10]|uniref:LysE family translocator n=1 Tax=Gulosibacter sp. 10 TaxID=1255570 RepID=UPI00097EB2E0|nr:LysE family translocator [Gulosibacter sp. 10]SJM69106.1 Threonine efflux protein [Gulosibacter sp. 10]
MEQFLAVAIAHFVSLLIPGVDFFLIARVALAGGWRNATGACLGIALANGAFIAAAFSGIALITRPPLLDAIQAVGGGFLVFMGIAFLRSPARIDLEHGPSAARGTWLRNLGLGLASGLLNPKNALFYVSLAAAVPGEPPLTLALYGAWMFGIVLAWDVLVAVMLGSRRALGRMRRALPWLGRGAGVFLLLFGAGMLLGSAMRALA